jgi:signal transduction protein with GAF and PtsI domain
LVQRALLESLENKEAERRGYQQQMLEAERRLRAYEHQRGPGAATADRTGRFKGLPAAPGFGIGRASLMVPDVSFTNLPRRRRRSGKEEIGRFERAVKRAVRDLARLRKRVQESFPEIDAGVVEAQRLMLLDSNFTQPVIDRIKGGATAEAALGDVVHDMATQFSRLAEPYMQERSLDIKDIGQRVLRVLLGVSERGRSVAGAVVLVAPVLTLTDVLAVGQEHIKGIVIATGGVTSHAAFLA